MSVPERISGAITTHSKVVVLALLVTTAVIGAGAGTVDDDSSLDQFESDSPEAEAAEYITNNFTVDTDDDTTTVQLIVRGENVLSQESILASLEYQRELHENESIGATLEGDPVGVENLIATTAILEERGDELEAEFGAFEAEQQALAEDQQELSARTETLNDSLDEAVALSLDPGTEDYEAEVEPIRDGAVDDASLEEEQAETFDEALALVGEADGPDDPEITQAYAMVLDPDEGLFADEWAEIEARGEEIESWGEELHERTETLESGAGNVSLAEQIEKIESMDDGEFEEALLNTLADDGDNFALELMPVDYEPETTSAEARMTMITQNTSAAGGTQNTSAAGGTQNASETGGSENASAAKANESGEGPPGFDGDVLDAQRGMQAIGDEQDDDYIVFGAGPITEEIDQSMGDSLAIVGPFALLFVVLALAVAYRDPLDIVLGVVGIFVVLVWTFGFMGWAGIAFNQMFVAVPVLLIGLSIDYAIHVFMRHREQREADAVTDSVRGSMDVALLGVGVALIWVTATAALGFLANLVSPIGPVQEFGIVSAFGIVAALIIFGALVPAVKVELDSVLESFGIDRRKRAFGTGGSFFGKPLSIGAVAARKAPVAVLVLALVVTASGAYGAAHVDTSFDEEDFLADSPPEWTDQLPDALAPGEYRVKADLEYVTENFQREDTQAAILVEGDVTDDETLTRLAGVEDEAAEGDVVYVGPSGDPDVESPLSVMEQVAAANETFNETFTDADTSGDGIPDRNLETVYDELYDVDEAAATRVLHRTDEGEYEAIRVVVGVRGDAGFDETTDELRSLAAVVDDGGDDDRWVATATGDPVVAHVVEQDLLSTVFQSLGITLVSVFAFLTLAYWLTGKGALLGTVTLLPVAFSVSWILGTMYLLEIPFNVLTGMITSLTIGLGVAYSIHVSSRYTLELERQGNVWDALHTTVTGTGGALLGSAATTIGGFGTLALAILPVLQQFGIITGLTIAYAFLASVVVLPSLLVLWTRYAGPDVSFGAAGPDEAARVADEGGKIKGSGSRGTDE